MFKWLYWKLADFLTYRKVKPFLSFADRMVEWVLSIGFLMLIIIGPAYTLQFFGIVNPKGLHFTFLHYLAIGVGDIFLLSALAGIVVFVIRHPERFGRSAWRH